MTPLETVVQFVLRMAASLVVTPAAVPVPVRIPQDGHLQGRTRRAPPSQLLGW